MRIKICGITNSSQGLAIANLGATALGFICVSQSPRYVTPEQIKAINSELPAPLDKIGVFADTSCDHIVTTVVQSGLTGVQLHGTESTAFCVRLRELLPEKIEVIKAFRIKTPDSLGQIANYCHCVDTLLLDAYHPQMLGGTGQTINWQDLQQFKPQLPWMLAGGLTPDNLTFALEKLHPDGIDLSSGVERSPGDKDLTKVKLLFDRLTAKRDFV